MRVIFNGDLFDKQADSFFKGASLIGRGVLNHPRWGQKFVQVLSCTQSEDWIGGVGEAVFEVEFQESLDREFATPVGGTTYEVADLAEGYNQFAKDNFDEGVDIDTLDQATSFKDTMAGATQRVYEALSTLATGDDKIASIFNESYLDIVTNLDEYVGAPARFAESIIRMISIPATLYGRVDSKIIAYKSLLDNLPFTNVDDDSRETKNKLLTNELVGTTCVSSVSLAITEAVANTSTIQRDEKGRALIIVPEATVGFQTRSEALASALYMRNIFVELVDYLDTGQSAFLTKTLAEMYAQVIQSYAPLGLLVSKAIEGAINLSFGLPAKRSVILTNASTIINECNKYYGGVADGTLDFFIQTNELNGDEIMYLPKGKTIIYYA
jgi:hypothetical protein